MQDARRLNGRPFYWAVIFAASLVTQAGAQSGPVLTTIVDTVYRADGTPAQGTLVITWPAFSTAAGQAVAAGENTVTLGTAGALDVQLAPNLGSTPGNTVYTIVYQLDDGTNKTEFWTVGTTSPETLAQIRTQLGSNTSTQQFATESYVNGALAAKANDNAVVHLSGAEVITGAKQFSVSPAIPTPVNTTDAANKAYVDNSVENAGAGNYVSKAGDTMTGPLTLPGAPTAPNQAATKQYVDTGIASKADLVTGVVPTLINAANLQCAIAFTELIDAIDTEVRSALPGATFSTLLVGDLSEGAECTTTSSELEFFSAYAPAANQQVEVHYRGRGRAIARITNPLSIAAQQRGVDTGVHGVVRRVKLPPARTAADCENAALAILDDSVNLAWSGQYETWSDFLPGGAMDILPGDALSINAPSRGASFAAIVREVQITVEDLAGEHSRYLIQFATDAAKPLAFEFETSSLTVLPEVNSYANTQVGEIYIGDLTAAQITQVTSTTVTIDAGNAPPSGGGIEVRWSDEGWGVGNNRNLLGRFTSQTFTLPRLARTVDFFVQQYDASNPPRYSRFSAALHLDFPLTATM
jgi:hypothetical protein